MIKSKVCTKCKEEKSVDNFYRRRDATVKYRSHCKLCTKKACNIYRKANTELYIEAKRKYRRTEKYKSSYEKYKDRAAKLLKVYYHNNMNYKIAQVLKTRLRRAIKSGGDVENLGCSIGEFKLYIENYFPLYPGMSWGNYGSEWHLDHYLPLSSFNLEDKTELQEACHYTNIQPLWSGDNLSKGYKTPYDQA